MMKYGKLVPSLHLKPDKSNLNPSINLEQHDLDISLAVRDWKTNDNRERIGCVNSFGFGGSNCHAIVVNKASFQEPLSTREDNSIVRFVCLSAVDLVGMENTLLQFLHDLEESRDSLSSISYTSTKLRDHFPYRSCFTVKTLKELRTRLSNAVVEDKKPNMTTNLVFVYCGVGTTWQGMCSTLMKCDQTFRTSIENIDKYLIPTAGFSIAKKFCDEKTDYNDPFLSHIAIFCAQVALTEMWKKLGIFPNVIIGQSVGEVAASYSSGSINMADAVDVIYKRSKLLSIQTGGVMMVVKNIEVKLVEEVCNRFDHKVTVAVYSSPVACTLSGDADIMPLVKMELLSISKEMGSDILLIDLNVTCAYHSHHMQPCVSEIKKQLMNIQPQNRSIPVISTVTGKLATITEFQTGEYWAQNIRQPVKFSEAIIGAAKENAKNIYVEIGPKGVLAAHFKDIFKQEDFYCYQSMRYKKELETKTHTMQQLYEHGININWETTDNNGQLIATVPRYGFNRLEHLHFPEVERRKLQGLSTVGSSEHTYVQQSLKKGTSYQLNLNQQTTPFVYDHFMSDKVLVPGAVYVEAALAVGHKLLKRPVNNISVSVEFKNPLFPVKGIDNEIECEVKKTKEGNGLTFLKDKRVLCTAMVLCKEFSQTSQLDPESIKRKCLYHMKHHQVYDKLKLLNFKYGSSLSLIQQAWVSENECIAEIAVPDTLLEEMGRTHLHPAIVDATFQLFGVLKKESKEKRQSYPRGVKSVILNRAPCQRMYAYAVSTGSEAGRHHFNALILSADGSVICELNDFYTDEQKEKLSDTDAFEYSLEWCLLPEDDMVEFKESKTSFPEQTIFIVCPESKQNFFTAVCGHNRVVFHSTGLTHQNASNNYKNKLASFQKHAIAAVIFAPTSHSSNKCGEIYSTSKHSFTRLSELLLTLDSLSLRMPIYIVTERTQKIPQRNSQSINVHDSHIWGMVRCARHEFKQTKLCLVDIDPENCDQSVFCKVIAQGFEQEDEFAIDNLAVFVSRVKPLPLDKSTNMITKDINVDPDDLVYLRSATHSMIEKPSFVVQAREKTESVVPLNAMCIRLTSVGLHKTEIYSVTSNLVDEKLVLWPDLAKLGFQGVGVEGTGTTTCVDKNNVRKVKDQTVYFCYPVDIATYINVPKELTVAQSVLPFYQPGLLTVSLLLLKISTYFEYGSSVCIVADEVNAFAANFLTYLLKVRNRCSAFSLAQSDLMQGNHTSAVVPTTNVAFLSMIDSCIVSGIIDIFPSLSHIVTISSFLPKDSIRWVKHNHQEIALSLVSSDDMFKDNTLKSSFSQVIEHLIDFYKKDFPNISGDDDTIKDVLSLPWKSLSLTHDQKIIPLRVTESHLFRKNGCYVVVGGLTGLGWELMKLIAESGGGHIASISRRRPTEEKVDEINKIMLQHHVHIHCIQADITDLENVKTAFLNLKQTLNEVKIKGIFNGAGVIADNTLAQMTDTEIDKAMRPKILGSWNLHLVSQNFKLDFFVLHSSVVSVLGNEGQCNYAAGNAFMDSLAHYRTSRGMCAQSINWGVLDIGMTQSNANLLQYLQGKGLNALSVTDIGTCFIKALMAGKVQVTIGKFDWSIVCKNEILSPKLVEVAPNQDLHIVQKGTTAINFSIFEKLTKSEKSSMLQNIVKDSMCQVVPGLNQSDIFPATGTAQHFVESLQTVTFVNKLQDLTGYKLDAQILRLEETTIGGVVGILLENIVIEDVRPSEITVYDPILALNAEMTFMEQAVIIDYKKNPENPALLRVFDVEIKGLKFDSGLWKQTLQHVVIMNKELCKVYNMNTNEISARYLSPDSVDVSLEIIPFESVGNCDVRHGMSIDISKEIPVKFQIAHKEECIILRMILHAVITDLATVALICKDIRSTAIAIVHGHQLPPIKEPINLSTIFHTKVNGRFLDLRSFWTKQMRMISRPITLGKENAKKLNGKYCRFVQGTIPSDITQQIFLVLRKKGCTLFQLFTSIYQLFLHRSTALSIIPVLSTADMRIHAPELQGYAARCINNIPFIAEFGNGQTVEEFVTTNTRKVAQAVENCAYPYQLIEKEISSENMREHIGRHRIVMDNLTDFNATMKYKDLSIRIKDAWHTRDEYETFWYIEYNTDTKLITYQFGYNAQVCGEEGGASIPQNLISLLRTCCVNPNELCFPDKKRHDKHDLCHTITNNSQTRDSERKSSALNGSGFKSRANDKKQSSLWQSTFYGENTKNSVDRKQTMSTCNGGIHSTVLHIGALGHITNDKKQGSVGPNNFHGKTIKTTFDGKPPMRTMDNRDTSKFPEETPQDRIIRTGE